MIRLDLLNQSIEFYSLNSFSSICLYNTFTRQNILILAEIRLSRRALRPSGPFFLNQSIKLNNLNNLGSLWLYKVFNSKKIFKWRDIWLSGRALTPVGLFFFWNRWIESYKLSSLPSRCVKKIFTSKQLWIKTFKNFVNFFLSIFESRRASAPLERQNWK